MLLPLLQKTTDSRHAAMLRSVDKVCRLYAIPREMILRRAEGSTNIYKQHVLQALMDAGYASEMFGEVFKKLYDSKTGIAYEKVDYPDIDTVMDAIDAAEGHRGLGASERIPQHGSSARAVQKPSHPRH